MKAPISKGHNYAPLLRKGGLHQEKQERIPELEYDLIDYYLEETSREVDSPESFFII